MGEVRQDLDRCCQTNANSSSLIRLHGTSPLDWIAALAGLVLPLLHAGSDDEFDDVTGPCVLPDASAEADPC